MKNLAAELLTLLRVVGFLTGAALAMFVLAVVMNTVSEIAWARPALALLVLVVAGAVVLYRRRPAEEELVIDLTDDARVDVEA